MITNAADIEDDMRGKRFGERAGEVRDHARSGSRLRQNREAIRAVLTFALLLLIACAASAGDWFFLPAPRFMRHEVSFPISGAKDTVLAPAKLGESGIEFPTVAAWHEARLDEDAVRKVTARYASELLQHVKVEWFRNSKNVVEYATLHSEKLPVCEQPFIIA